VATIDPSESGKSEYARGAVADPIITITIDEAQCKAYAVLSSQGELPTLEEVLNASRAENVPFWIDEAAIAKALENQLLDQPFEIGYAKDGRVVVTVAAGEMEAYMLLEPAYGGKELNFTDVEQALREKSITVGVDETAIRQALADGNYGSKLLIARGKDPVNGTDATIEYFFRKGSTLKPKDTDDRIDYRDLESVVSVHKESILAKKTAAIPGEDGMTVTDKPVRAIPGKDVKLSPGKNTRLSEDGLEIVSNIDGQPVLLDKVSVEPLIIIDGDIDYKTGNVDFSGSVKVSGGVLSGFSVKATANIQIDGVVEDSYVEAGGDVLVRGGIRGRGSKTVKAGGNVGALFIEQAVVEAGAGISSQEVLHSDLVAGDQVSVTKGKGLIFGGHISATNLIHANTVGADSGIRTELAVGFNPMQKATLDSMKEKRTKYEASLSEIEIGTDTLERYKSQGSSMWQRHEETYEKLVEARRQLKDKLDELAFEIGVMEERMVRAEHAHIKIAKTIYPNVVVRIGRLQFNNESELGSTSFYEDEGEIKSSVYVL
jgi:uncharacterized protein (DUF342 family)